LPVWFSPPFPSPLPFLPVLPLEVRPLNPARSLGERCRLPQRGLGRSLSRNRTWCILAYLLATVVIIFLIINLPDFVQAFLPVQESAGMAYRLILSDFEPGDVGFSQCVTQCYVSCCHRSPHVYVHFLPHTVLLAVIYTVASMRVQLWRGRGRHQGAATRNKRESRFYWTTTLAI